MKEGLHQFHCYLFEYLLLVLCVWEFENNVENLTQVTVLASSSILPQAPPSSRRRWRSSWRKPASARWRKTRHAGSTTAHGSRSCSCTRGPTSRCVSSPLSPGRTQCTTTTWARRWPPSETKGVWERHPQPQKDRCCSCWSLTGTTMWTSTRRELPVGRLHTHGPTTCTRCTWLSGQQARRRRLNWSTIAGPTAPFHTPLIASQLPLQNDEFHSIAMVVALCACVSHKLATMMSPSTMHQCCRKIQSKRDQNLCLSKLCEVVLLLMLVILNLQLFYCRNQIASTYAKILYAIKHLDCSRENYL